MFYAQLIIETGYMHGLYRTSHLFLLPTMKQTWCMRAHIRHSADEGLAAVWIMEKK